MMDGMEAILRRCDLARLGEPDGGCGSRLFGQLR